MKKNETAPMITAGQIMTKPVISIHRGDTVRSAASVFLDKKISGAPVVNHLGEPVGVLTKTDIIRYEREYAAPRLGQAVLEAMKGSETLEIIAHWKGFHQETEDDYVDRWMTKGVYSIGMNASIASVVREMAKRRIHRIFIQNEKTNRLVGVITTFDLLKFMARVFFVSSEPVKISKKAKGKTLVRI